MCRWQKPRLLFEPILKAPHYTFLVTEPFSDAIATQPISLSLRRSLPPSLPILLDKKNTLGLDPVLVVMCRQLVAEHTIALVPPQRHQVLVVADCLAWRHEDTLEDIVMAYIAMAYIVMAR